MVRILVGLLTIVMLMGCADEPQGPRANAQQKVAPPAPKPPPPPPPPQPQAPEPPYPRGGGMELSSDPLQPDVKDTLRVKAQVGVGKKGRGLEDPGLVQMIVTPAKAYFRTQERLVFEVQIPQALSLYEASNGSKPKTQQEFMEQVIAANNIRLPELPAGQRYVYDPEIGELMVEKPAR